MCERGGSKLRSQLKTLCWLPSRANWSFSRNWRAFSSWSLFLRVKYASSVLSSCISARGGLEYAKSEKCSATLLNGPSISATDWALAYSRWETFKISEDSLAAPGVRFKWCRRIDLLAKYEPSSKLTFTRLRDSSKLLSIALWSSKLRI